MSTAAVVAAMANPPAIDTSPAGHDGLGPDALGQLGGERCRRRREHGEGDGADAGFQRAVPAHELEVLRDDEDEAEEGEEGERHGHAAGGEAQVGEHRDVEHRMVDAALPPHEAGEQDGGESEGEHARRRQPAVHRAFDDGPHEQR